MIKICSKCQQIFTTAFKWGLYCYECRNLNWYLRKARRFTTLEVLEDLRAKGCRVSTNEDSPLPFHIYFRLPPERQVYTVRHMTKRPHVDLVARGDDHDTLKYIPTCGHRCVGCYKCRLAATLNGETAAEARDRRTEPRSRFRIGPKRNHHRARFSVKNVTAACADTGIDVHSQVEDID